jgi:hypothetical protein
MFEVNQNAALVLRVGCVVILFAASFIPFLVCRFPLLLASHGQPLLSLF